MKDTYDKILYLGQMINKVATNSDTFFTFSAAKYLLLLHPSQTTYDATSLFGPHFLVSHENSKFWVT